MTKRACIRATNLLAGRAGGLSDAETLALEQHLESCDSCATDEHDVYLLVVGTGASRVPGLTDRARDRAIAGALRGGDTVQTQAIWDGWRRWLAPGLGAAAVAAAAVAFVVVTGGDRTGATAGDVAVSHVVEGDVSTADGPLAAGDEIRPGVELTAEQGSTIAVGHARVELDAPSVLTWDEDHSTVSLRKGVLVAVVDPGPKREFRVQTSEFSVEVLGTRFEVTPESVYVMEGKVRVKSPDGEVWADELAAGESWFKPTLASSDTKRRKARRRRQKAAAEPAVEVAALLDSARAHLAAGDVSDARSELDRVSEAKPTRAESAEAQTLLAECALVGGEREKAVSMYLEVAERYRKLRAGENALFAAARLEARSGSPRRARTLLQRYLDRYPDGRFVDEAQRRLDELQ